MANVCELEGDTDPCGALATKEVFFPEDCPADGWLKACAECIDRRKDVFKMELRDIKEERPVEAVGRFAAEVATGDDPKFYGNALRFPTLEAASTYVQDLFCRWTSVRTWRVVEYVYAGWATVKVVVQVKS